MLSNNIIYILRERHIIRLSCSPNTEWLIKTIFQFSSLSESSNKPYIFYKTFFHTFFDLRIEKVSCLFLSHDTFVRLDKPLQKFIFYQINYDVASIFANRSTYNIALIINCDEWQFIFTINVIIEFLRM